MHDLTVAGLPVTFLVLYPSGGFSQSFPPGKAHEAAAHQHAQHMNGMLVALPLLADYRTAAAPIQGYGEAPVNPPSINALPEPVDGALVKITSGTRAGQGYGRQDKLAKRMWGDDTRVRWWSQVENRYKLWVDVQQQIGEASWEVILPDGPR